MTPGTYSLWMLGSLLLALVLAGWLNGWRCRVILLVALRLAIGWHFLFEGVYKIHSHWIGESESNKPFTSAPYFKASPTGLGDVMRRKFDDPEAVIAARVRIDNSIPLSSFMKLDLAGQTQACPESVQAALDGVFPEAEGKATGDAIKEVNEAQDRQDALFAKTKTDDERKALAKDYDPIFAAGQAKLKNATATAKERIEAAKIKYARWVYGVDGRDAKVKFTTGEASLTAPQRLAHIDCLHEELRKAEERQASGVGNGNGNGDDNKRVASLRQEYVTAQADLAKDANAFVAELRKELAGRDMPEAKPVSEGEKLDKFTMWFIAGVGACLLLGLFTRLACVLGAGFLIVTYITHPPFPWYPLPPNTEGNPLYINKNVIECLALLVLACYPTGRWLGLDAVLARIVCRKDGTRCPSD